MKALRMTAAAIEAGSMREVSGRFSVSPSAISQAVRKVEDHFGVPLFHRDVRPLMPTAAGLALASEMRAVEVIIEGMAGKVRATAASIGAIDLRIGLVDTVAGTIAAKIFQKMASEHPALRLSGMSGLADGVGEALSRRRIDIAITCDPAYNAGFETRPIATEQYVLLVKTTSLADLENLDLQEVLDRNVLVRHSGRSFVGAQVERYLQQAEVSCRRVFEFDMSDAVVALVANGAGVAITTPLCILQGIAHVEGVSVIPLPGPPLSRQLLVVFRRGEFDGYARDLALIARDILKTDTCGRFKRLAPQISGAIRVDGKDAATN